MHFFTMYFVYDLHTNSNNNSSATTAEDS